MSEPTKPQHAGDGADTERDQVPILPGEDTGGSSDSGAGTIVERSSGKAMEELNFVDAKRRAG